ncbi:MAG: phosphotransferase family protein [Pseudooceanicola sp.]|nr:phosphotransferase family protein [Pseudooceanicola sp.]
MQRAAALPCFRHPREIEPLGGGITNVNLRVRENGRSYVVRLGSDIPEHGVMRWNELALSRAAARAGLSPAVVHHEPGVLVLDFIEARTLTPEDVRNPKMLPRITDLIARAHRTLGPGLTQPVLSFWPFQVNRSYIARLTADRTRHHALLPGMQERIDTLEAATGPVRMVIGHNDLLAANLLDDGRKLWLIDWEYGGYNSPLFDLAGLASNNELSEAQERALLAQYPGTDPDRDWTAYSAMKCASLMRETLWSMTSEIHSEIDFDFAAYTVENLARLTAALDAFALLPSAP